MNITKDSIIGELVAHDYKTATVFKRNKIDFCCNGNRSIEDACDKKKVDINQLIEDLQNVGTAQSDSQIDYASWPLDLLADYIEKKHHRYVVEKSQEIMPFLVKIVRVHGSQHPELLEVLDLFQGAVEDLTHHMEKEEGILFPYIRSMVAAKSQGTSVAVPFGTVQNPINVMMQEHLHEGERFRTIADLTDNYTMPEGGCTTYRVTFAMLKEFEDDLHLHIHLENNILFPKSIAFEKQFVNA